MNILQLCFSSDLGGLELYVFHASEALNKNNKVFTALLKNSKLDKYYQQHSSIKRYYLKRNKNPVPLLNAKRLAAFIDKNSIDVIHMHLTKDLPTVAFAKAFSKTKPALVFTRHMMITRSKNDFYHNFMYRQIDLIVAITKQLETLIKTFIPLCKNRTTTLYTGVKQPKVFLDQASIIKQRNKLGFTKNDFIVGLIGRLEENKGQHLLIKAIHLANQNNHNIKALIIGHEMKPGYRETLKKQASDFAISENIKFHDFVSEPQVFMQCCDCVVLATSSETFGLVLPEAMRAGVAVIGSNSGGVPEIIQHRKSGLLFTSGDASSLYEQILRLQHDPAFKNKLASQGKSKADESFNNSTHFNQLEQLLKSASLN